MTIQRTLGIIKPDAVKQNKIGAIISMIEDSDMRIIAMRMLQLSRPQAEILYHALQTRSYFGPLIDFTVNGPIVVLCIEGEDAVKRYRDLMGATDSKEAAEGTIRKRFGSTTIIRENACHGSDSPERAAVEIDYFFSDYELGEEPKPASGNQLTVEKVKELLEEGRKLRLDLEKRIEPMRRPTFKQRYEKAR